MLDERCHIIIHLLSGAIYLIADSGPLLAKFTNERRHERVLLLSPRTDTGLGATLGFFAPIIFLLALVVLVLLALVGDLAVVRHLQEVFLTHTRQYSNVTLARQGNSEIEPLAG